MAQAERVKSKQRGSRIHYIAWILLICVIKLSADFENFHQDDFAASLGTTAATRAASSTKTSTRPLSPLSLPDLPGDASGAATFNSAVKFVFVVGLEGTGHHFMGSLIRESPSSKYLESIGVFPNMTLQLAQTLMNVKTNQALFNAHCDLTKANPRSTSLRMNARGRVSPLSTGPNIPKDSFKRPDAQRRLKRQIAPAGPDAQQFLRAAALRLKQVNDFVAAKRKQKATPLHIALNTVREYGHVGELSYPNGRGACRKSNYPNLDLLYQACNLAQVDCGHVYIFRDPFGVLRSTTERGMHSTVLEAIHLYVSYLYLILGMLATTETERTLGCWGIMTDEATDEEVWAPIRQMFQWTDDGFQHFFRKNYKKPRPMTEAQKQVMVPPKLKPYMQSMIKAHQSVVDVCRAQVAANKDPRGEPQTR